MRHKSAAVSVMFVDVLSPFKTAHVLPHGAYVLATAVDEGSGLAITIHRPRCQACIHITSLLAPHMKQAGMTES
eukprot:3213729-Amphidinium_carterae.1